MPLLRVRSSDETGAGGAATHAHGSDGGVGEVTYYNTSSNLTMLGWGSKRRSA